MLIQKKTIKLGQKQHATWADRPRLARRLPNDAVHVPLDNEHRGGKPAFFAPGYWTHAHAVRS